MAQQIKLGARPKSFARKLTVSLPEGGVGELPLVYRYRTRCEFGVFIDALLKKTGAVAQPGAALAEFSNEIFHAQSVEANADYILQIVESWGLPEPFDRDNVIQLCNELPGVAMEIINDYRAAITEGRLGN